MIFQIKLLLFPVISEFFVVSSSIQDHLNRTRERGRRCGYIVICRVLGSELRLWFPFHTISHTRGVAIITFIACDPAELPGVDPAALFA